VAANSQNTEKGKLMRRQQLTQLLGTLVVATALVGLPTAAFALITGSAHDLRGDIADPTANTEICQVCHTPHNALDTGATDASPLWNHEVSAELAYTLYSSGTLDAVDVGQPDGISKLCLSCHDGSVALDNYGGATGGANTIDTIDARLDFDTDLSNDHPISFTYNTALNGADAGVHDPSTTGSGITANIDDDMLFGIGNDQMECASCHDVHDYEGNDYLLLVSNTNSVLCLTCHNK
jgi:predicted CXXCH cytochrome family protein